MNCEKIKELILTDFTDGSLNEKMQKQVSLHLSSCVNCQEFAKTVSKIAIEPFKNAQKINPPDYLWYRIKDRIASQKPRPAFSGLFKNLQVLFHPRPAFALVTIAVVVIIASVFFQPYIRGEEINLYLNDQMDFVSHLGHNGNAAQEINFGTAIEELLL
jgi:anti-sigma factor RsiW